MENLDFANATFYHTIHKPAHGTLQVVQPDVVLASFDALASDISHLQPIDWEAVVVDERCKVQSNLAKAHQALRDVESNFRLLLPSGNPTLVRPRHIHIQPIVPVQSDARRPSCLIVQVSRVCLQLHVI